MITVQEAKQLIVEHTLKCSPIIQHISASHQHVLAADVYAICNIPAFKQSSMDGYAIKFSDKDLHLNLVGEMAAGTSQNLAITTGQASRTFTGAPLPHGADTVVMQEKISLENGKLIIQDNNLSLGLNTRNEGSEIEIGALAMQKGNYLTAAAIGFLAGIGITEVLIYPLPKVSIILTGKELTKPGFPLLFGQVYESNSYSLTAALNQFGITNVSVLEADDDLEILTRVIQKALSQSDIIILTGGVSVGDYDFVLEASKLCNIEQIFHKVKQKPGKPLFFGKLNQKLIFGLPGNPSSVLSCFYNYVLPAISLFSGKQNPVKKIKAELLNDYKKPIGLTHFLKGNYNDGKATALGAQDSYRLSSFAQANCLIILDEGEEHFAKGGVVNVLLIPE
ncbi:molybdopterin molybdotransferase MoeA [Pedobacter jejuensis]|uniref:Molybdopterin molybdenumtransferase n=1 Tax=Pedobacter jejuensis TaxID=1268550 RepID=A0A3N0C1R2_9SPHI|nr:gephyrin-like molybdotransferase Glp [Pedobacter jejuensis]RNL55771.1 molybdopterin molybdenumtransferase MoeA [Pedobacter jejuensis]